MKLLILFVFVGTTFGNDVGEAENDVTRLKLQYLEERIHSLEQPVWTVSWDRDRWKFCSNGGPCVCTHMTRTMNCWNLLDNEGLPSNQIVPWDVQILDLGSNFVPALSNMAFHHLTKLIELNLFDAQLEYVPKYAFHHLKELLYLKLSNNRITNLEPSLFRNLQKLKTLDLSSNRIHKLSKDQFMGNVELQSLQLSHNLIEEISYCPFDSLLHLKNLDISRNKLKRIDPCFTKLAALETLDLSGNQLTSCLSTHFAGLSNSLTHLHLSDNHIDSLEEAVFASLLRLKVLALNNNAIRTFDPGVLPLQLKELDLSKNLIDKIKKSSSAPIFGLASLDLSFNNLESISQSVLNEQFPYLAILKLNNNLIKEIQSSLPSDLKELYLQTNQLETLTEYDVVIFSKLQRIRLDDNLWNCNCKLIPMAKWIRSNVEKVSNPNRIECFSPQEHELQPLTTVLLEELNC